MTIHSVFNQYKDAIRSLPYGAVENPSLLIGKSEKHSLYYIPFEYVNPKAKLVIVGITPGPSQMQGAYEQTKLMLQYGKHADEILFEVKRLYAFSGKDGKAQQMRLKINEMLDHFGFPEWIGALDASRLWSTNYGDLYTTSVVPNAAFKNGKYFNGPFSDVLNSSLLRKCFEESFIESIKAMNSEAKYIAMGPVAWEALEWCADEGHLNEDQLIGYFPHASRASGSQCDYFLRRKRLNDLKPKDPVRARAPNLDAAYERVLKNKARLCG